MIELHRAYNRSVREVASARHWPVLDLAAELETLAAEDLRQVFLEDGIHLTTSGSALFAQRLSTEILRLTDPEAEG